jgi:methionyl-tRNA formyltransferase
VALIFFGTPLFAVSSLKALLYGKEDVSLVVTRPDRVKGRGHVLSAPPVKELALAHNIKVAQPVKIRDEAFYRELQMVRPEFLIVVAYGRLLPREVLAIPSSGCINVHGSLLPRYRGAAPIQRALINGEHVTGVTTMLMDEGMDTGDILLKAELEVRDDDTSESLSEKLSELGAATLLETLGRIREGGIKRQPQTGGPSYAPPLTKEEGRINWSRSAEELFNFVRGMYPWPSAFCYLTTERIKITKARPCDGAAEAGLIVKASGGELLVGTGKGLLAVEELQPEGKKIMPARAFVAGRKLEEGRERFS